MLARDTLTGMLHEVPDDLLRGLAGYGDVADGLGLPIAPLIAAAGPLIGGLLKGGGGGGAPAAGGGAGGPTFIPIPSPPQIIPIPIPVPYPAVRVPVPYFPARGAGGFPGGPLGPGPTPGGALPGRLVRRRRR